MTLFSLLCNVPHRMQFPPYFLNGGGANNFLNKIKQVGAEQLL